MLQEHPLPARSLHPPPHSLAILGTEPAFAVPVYVGQPSMGNRASFLQRVEEMLDRRWFTNNGPLVKEFESRIAARVGVKHCIAMGNATIALQAAIQALELTGEVIVPAYTFVATVHALCWQNIKPVFVDVSPHNHNLDPNKIESLVGPNTTGIIGVHLWGRPCDVEAIEAVASKHGLKVMYDAAHAFGCSHAARMIGAAGQCEVFSFHATKFLNSFEGGAVTTNDDGLAKKLRLVRNFGFAGIDNVVALGTNAKMTEVCAAMGITSLEAMADLISHNRTNYESYGQFLADIPGLSLIQYDPSQSNNYQYIVVEIDPQRSRLNRDELAAVLWAENVQARKYFWPGCHQMEPYRSRVRSSAHGLPETDRIAARVLVLPTGQTVQRESIATICRIIRQALEQSSLIRHHLKHELRRG
jgi:dTDP-4-amino-4,6-dideoxygalactose transaminase